MKMLVPFLKESQVIMGNNNPRLSGIALAIWFLFLLAGILPEHLWGLHHPVFLPKGLRIALMGGTLLLILFSWRPSFPNFLVPNLKRSKSLELLWVPLVAALLGGIIFHLFPLLIDPYGDARYIFTQLDGKINNWDAVLLENFLSTDFLDSKIGGDSVSFLAALLAFFTGKTVGETLILLNTACGMVFLFVWFRLTAHVVSDPYGKMISWILGLSSPILLMFAGHYEYYAPVYLFVLTCLYALIRLEQTHQKRYVVYLGLFFLLAIKFHITSYLLVIPIGLKFWHYQKNVDLYFPSWEWIFKYILFPLFVLGLILYFGVLQSYDGPRSFSPDSLEDALLLPLYTKESMLLNQYNLLSWSHIFDYINLILWWSPIAFLILIAAFKAFPGKIDWETPSLKLIGLCLFAYMGAFFVLNPLLSMPIDWDLFSIPGISFLVLAMLIIGQINDRQLLQPLLVVSFAIGILSTSVWWVHTNSSSLSARLEAVGKHTYKTYWLGTSSTVYHALGLIKDENERQENLLRIIEELKPYALPDEDTEYADFLCQAGIFYFEKDKQDIRALNYFRKAFEYRPNLSRNVYYLLASHFMRGEFEEAHTYSKLLIAVRYPNYQKAFKMGIHTAIEAEAYEDALVFCQHYLELWPNDAFIEKVLQNLLVPEARSKAKFLFQKNR